ncbi:MAG TPA: NAD(P)H-dependent oxidoreductase subunit E [Anaerolineae bacterium]|nr:NAD(P)H-dependent oxidoreductase subunit E [Anaerolineae bacterium]
MEDTARIDAIIAGHQGKTSGLTTILQDIQNEYNYLPPQAIERVAEKLGLPLIQVLHVATFYKAFSLEPRGKHLITVCLGTACHVRGGARIVDQLERSLNVRAGGTTADGLFTLETVNCVGACALGPVVVVDGEYHGKMAPSKVERMLKKYGKQEA